MQHVINYFKKKYVSVLRTMKMENQINDIFSNEYALPLDDVQVADNETSGW